MKVLMIAPGFLPYTFSENLCNGKLAFALQEYGHQICIISRSEEGQNYGANWEAPWDVLQSSTHEITYASGSRIERLWDSFWCLIKTRYPFDGVRWVARAVEEGTFLLKNEKFDCIISRSPNDIAHVVGYHLARRFQIPWIANWNDPASPIWPEPYCMKDSFVSKQIQNLYTKLLLRNADCNTFPADSLRMHFQKNYPFLSKQSCAIIPHIGLIQAYLPKTKKIERKDKVMHLCHAGNLSAERNPEMFFKALARFNVRFPGKIHLDILGHRTSDCDRLQKKYDLDELIGYPGSFPYLKAMEKMAEYDVLVLLEAQMETGVFFASKTVDYVQLNKPILAISPPHGFAADYLGKNKVCVVDNRSPEAIEKSLEELYQNFCIETLSQNFVSKELQREFAPENVVHRLMEIIENLSKPSRKNN